jgi:hypothetical protein
MAANMARSSNDNNAHCLFPSRFQAPFPHVRREWSHEASLAG